VTDASLPILVNHGAKLRLEDARVSAKGFSDLKVALPGADIVWSERNRTAAEAVLAAGGKLSIRSKGQADDRPVAAASELPAKYFQVSRVKGLKELRRLVLDACPTKWEVGPIPRRSAAALS
jgi:hypothetical protein